MKTGSDDDDPHTLRKLIAGSAAAAPFLGYVGRQRAINDPNLGAKPLVGRQNLHELMMEAQPGDVVVYRNPLPLDQATPYVSGSHWSHAEPVVGKHEGLYGTTALSSEAGTRTIGERAQQWGSQEAALLRPEEFLNTGGQTTPQIENFKRVALEESAKPWDYARSIRSGIREVFTPKIPYITERGQSRVHRGEYCGQNCATSSGEAYAAAFDKQAPVVQGKGPRDLLPVDYMRSPRFRLISHTYDPELEHLTRSQSLLRELGPRLGLAALLGGGAYALGGLPLVPAVAAGYAAPGIARGLAGLVSSHTGGGFMARHDLPKLHHLIKSIMNPGTDARLIRSQFLKRTLPLGVGAGALAWLASRKASKEIDRRYDVNLT